MTLQAQLAAQEQAVPRVETAEAADALCVRLSETMTELIDVLVRETDLLKRGRPQDIAALHARKTALSAVMTSDMQLLARNTEFVKKAVPRRIAEIQDQHGNLQLSLSANQDALHAMKAVSEQILHTIAEKAGAKRSGPEVYGNNAGLAAPTPVRPAAISVDRSL